mgnify:CR=1 FL=1
MIKSRDVVPYLGLLWGILPLFYIIPGGNIIFYLLQIVVSLFLFLILSKKEIPTACLGIAGIGAVFFVQSGYMDAHQNFVLSNYLGLTLFVLNISLLISLVDRESILAFSRNFFIFSSVCAIIHIIFIKAGLISGLWGRFSFFGGSHPNLGGEIFAISAFAGAISMKKSSFLLLCIPMLISTYFMETRTGMIVIGLTALMKIIFEVDGELTKSNLLRRILLCMPIVIVILLEGSLIRGAAEEILLASDPDRGLATGFVSGRNYQWMQAWESFTLHPWFGSGMGLYEDSMRGAHNPFLYSISMYGVVGLIFWIWLGWYAYSLVKSNFKIFIFLLPSTLMLVLNDRFMNSNSFPLLFYFYVIQFGRFTSVHWNAEGTVLGRRVKFFRSRIRIRA